MSMTKRRSSASLMASGVATLTLDQRIKMPRIKSTVSALEADSKNIKRDAQRALRAIELERARA